MDFNLDKLTKAMILYIINKKGKLGSIETTWFSLTKQMFKNYPAVKVWEQVEMALCEVSDDQWFENKYPKEIFIEKFVQPQIRKRERKKIIIPNNASITAKITASISILDIADEFGLRPLGKLMRICPFHADSNPSLSLSDEKGLFNCFGCHESGNIIKFYAMLKELNPKFIYHKNDRKIS